MSVRYAALLPTAMTFDGAFEDRLNGDGSEALGHGATGRPLTRRFVAYLSLSRLTPEERLEQLRDLSPALARALDLYRAGHRTADVAQLMGISRRLASDYLRRGRQYVVGAAPHEELSDMQRFAVLELTDRQAADAWSLTAYGWRQDAIAGCLAVDVRTVKRAMARARASLGEPSRLRGAGRRETTSAARASTDQERGNDEPLGFVITSKALPDVSLDSA